MCLNKGAAARWFVEIFLHRNPVTVTSRLKGAQAPGSLCLAPASGPCTAHPALVLCYHPQISLLPTAAAAAAATYAVDLQGPG